jgi:N-acetylneuraminate synthase
MPSTLSLKVGSHPVGPHFPCFVIAEIGINHNGSLSTAKQLIDAAISAGADAVKFQKRTVDLVYSKEELDRPRESPYGTTNRELKMALEFGEGEYAEIDSYCRKRGIPWFASCWDERSVDFIEKFDPPCIKIPSALLTHDRVLKYVRQTGRPMILSTGMSTMEQIRHAVSLIGEQDLLLMHCTASYPCKPADLNLRVIQTFQNTFGCPVGYSGHEVGLQTSVAAVVVGACAVERHITLDRAMWGTDQPASVEPHGFSRLVRDIRVIEEAMGDGCKRVFESELPVLAKLRRTTG